MSALPRRRAPLAPRSAAPYLVAVVSGAMCFLAVAAMAAAEGAGRIAGAWTDGLGGAATVRMPAAEGRGAAEPAAAAILALLGRTAGIADARLLGEAETAALVAPWLGEGLAWDALPLPLLIDVTLDDPPPDAAEIASALAAVAPGAVWDDHGAWRAPLERAATTFARFAAFSVGLMTLALVAMVAAAARASLAGAAVTVRTMRLLGAHDGRVASVFDRPIALRAFVGGAVGAPAAALAVAAAPALGVAESLGAPSAPAAPTVARVVAAPLAATAAAYATARLSMLAILRRAP